MKHVLTALCLIVTLAASSSANAGRADNTYLTVPRAAWADADPADSLYRAARRALNDKDFEAAARMFETIVARYPKSAYAPDALYWKGFALYRSGILDEASEALEAQAKRYPNAATRGDGAALLIQVKGQLARRGDQSARRDVDSEASKSGKGCADMDVQVAALDAVQQLDPERAVPLLRRVLARRDACSISLRKNALFMLAQKQGAERERMLLEVAKSDPDIGVRQDAVFHLQQARSDAAVDALEDLLLHSDDRGVKANAIFALAQMKTDRARKILRAYALSNDAAVGLRKDAMFHLAQSKDATDDAFLKEMYGKVNEPEIKSDIMFYLAARPTPENARWLASIATNPKESAEQQKNALFHLAQRKTDGYEEMLAAYDKVSAPMRKEIIFYIAQRKDGTGLDKLISIAKTDPSTELRKEALFHIGQSRDPKAIKALEDIVNP